MGPKKKKDPACKSQSELHSFSVWRDRQMHKYQDVLLRTDIGVFSYSMIAPKRGQLILPIGIRLEQKCSFARVWSQFFLMCQWNMWGHLMWRSIGKMGKSGSLGVQPWGWVAVVLGRRWRRAIKQQVEVQDVLSGGQSKERVCRKAI